MFGAAYEHVCLVNVSLIVVDFLPAEQHPTVISEFFKAPLAAKYPCESGCKKTEELPTPNLSAEHVFYCLPQTCKKKMRWFQIIIAFQSAPLWVAGKPMEKCALDCIGHACQLTVEALIYTQYNLDVRRLHRLCLLVDLNLLCLCFYI